MTVTVTHGSRKYEWRKGRGWFSDKNRRVTSYPLIKKLDNIAFDESVWRARQALGLTENGIGAKKIESK